MDEAVENTASDATVTATSPIAPIAPMPMASLAGPRASRPAHDHDAGREARGTGKTLETVPSANSRKCANGRSR